MGLLNDVNKARANYNANKNYWDDVQDSHPGCFWVFVLFIIVILVLEFKFDIPVYKTFFDWVFDLIKPLVS